MLISLSQNIKMVRRCGIFDAYTSDELLYIGDELRDIKACNKLAVPFMWVSWGLDGFELIEKENPTYIAHTQKELIKILC